MIIKHSTTLFPEETVAFRINGEPKAGLIIYDHGCYGQTPAKYSPIFWFVGDDVGTLIGHQNEAYTDSI